MRDKIDPFQPPSSESHTSQQNETVVRLPLTDLHPFKGYPTLRGVMPRNQPYLVRDDDPTMIQLVARIKERGVTYPGVVRPDPEGGYEIISGQRRHRASELAGIPDMPVIVRDLDDEEAVTEMIDSNVNREDVLPSERAWAYRMRLEVEKRRAGRPEKNSPKISANFRSDDEVGKSLGISGDTLRNYIQLTELRQELMDKVDAQEIGLSIAYQIAALTKDEQVLLLDAMEYSLNTPSLSQAQRLKKASKEGTLSLEIMRSVLSEEKKAETEKVSFPMDTIRKYFPRSYTPKRMQETIIKLLEAWQKKRQRSQER
ncbi:ParB/RepB/Spo0J family partition protein [Flavonifractor sp. An91]|uniref:ParB/RepB/Spo0J family partition protein n=1 Tax=Flavonifractor sp. An91 TaxID=1965665 RepID=UPI001FA86665|nr:ParB/RepB/Spo0J family partition protein [Flavonifractor sp. An91]